MAVVAPSDEGHSANAFDDLLRRHPPGVITSGSSRFSALVSWLVATTRPALTVELGPADSTSLLSTCEAVERSSADAKCAAVVLSTASAGVGADIFPVLLAELGGRFGSVVQGYESEEACLAALADEQVGLVHVALSDSDEMTLPDVAAWQQALAPGAIMVVTTTAADVSSNFAKAKRQISDQYPTVSISLGLSTEAIVMQKPLEESTPVVDMLRKAPFAIGDFLALYGGQVGLQHLLRDEPEPSVAVQALIGRVIEQQHAEREAYLSALRLYQEETARLTTDVSAARADLSHQIEASRLEREHLVKEFLDRVDQLSSKISTSAARYSSQLALKDSLLEAEGRRVEDYAGIAAIIQSQLDDLRQSTSWRITAPVRLFSRVFGRRPHNVKH